MPNEDIITALHNSIERGESLQTAIQILINSGYNPAEVQEASRYIGDLGAGKINMQTKQEEQLTMPEEKKFLLKYPKLPHFSTPAPRRTEPRHEAMQIKKQMVELKPRIPEIEILEAEDTPPLEKQLNKLTPKINSHVKEIMLLIILLFLIGVLILTIFFKDTIIGWLS